MNLGLQGKVAIVTGGALGLGRSMSVALAREGVRVAIADVKVPEAEKALGLIRESGGDGMVIQTDVTRSAEVYAMVDRVLKTYGRIDILVNNAGIVGPQGPWHLLSEEGFDRVVGINFKGTYLCTKAVAPHMIEQKSGRIIITSSCAGKTGEQFNGCYSATKAVGVNMTHSLSRELAPYNITVNSVCPAAMDTDLMDEVYRNRSKWFGETAEQMRKRIKGMYPLPYDVTTEDVADLTVFLCSDHARNITGQSINVTGGIEVH
jgi:NAD(P)-dependent dehydrogenase (short-subunit alcohol dehydrogenase family)